MVDFDLPAGRAEQTLRLFATQSGVPLVFRSEVARGARSNAVRGSFPPREALNLMLEDSGLVATYDSRTGVFAIAAAPVPLRPSNPTPPVPTESNMAPATSPRNVIAAVLALLIGTKAQGADTPSPEASVTLSPFVVNTDQDQGYIASDSLVGGRMSTNLLKTPQDVSVLTSEFLSDIAATSPADAARYLTGALVEQESEFGDYGTQVTFRGLGNVNGGYPSRNYFRFNGIVDAYISERLEGARGPNSLLFGEGVVAGVLNTITKRARFGKSFSTFSARGDSEGGFRVTADINRPLNDKVALRINLVGQEGRKWIENWRDDRRGLQLAGSWRPWQGGEIRVEGEWMNRDRVIATEPIRDAVTNWDGSYVITSMFSDPAAARPAPPASAGVARQGRRYVFGNSFGTELIYNMQTYGYTTGTNAVNSLNTEVDFGTGYKPLIPRSLNIQPSNTEEKAHSRVLGAYFTQDFGRDFSTELAFQRATLPHNGDGFSNRWNLYTIDVNQKLPDGRDNPNYLKPFAETQINHATDVGNVHTDYRLAGVYVLPVESFRQRFNLIVSRREERFANEQWRYARAGTNLNAAANQIFIRRYFDEGDAPFVEPVDGSTISGQAFAVAGQPTDVFNLDKLIVQDTHEKQQLDTLQFATVGSYWKDRINLLGGVRHDRYKRYATSIGTRSSVTGQPETYTIAETDVEVTTSSVGTVVFPIPQLGFYLNYSESFNPAASGNAYLDGSAVQPTNTTGKSAGLRFVLADGRIVGSAGYYNTFERGRNANYVSSEINQIWTDLDRTDRLIDSGGYRDSLTAGGDGYEIDFVANLTKNLRARFNVALPDNEQKDTLPQLRAYYAANIAEWRAGAADTTNPNAARIQTNIDALELRMLNANEGRKIDGLPDYTANFFVNYTIPSGPLKSLRIGGGGNFVGKRIIGNTLSNAYDYIYNDAYSIYTATLGYNFKWMKNSWDVQLNVNNLFDYDDPIYRNTANYRGTIIPSAYHYIDPRQVILTATLRF